MTPLDSMFTDFKDGQIMSQPQLNLNTSRIGIDIKCSNIISYSLRRRWSSVLMLGLGIFGWTLKYLDGP